MTSQTRVIDKLARYLPLGATVIGMVVIFGSIVFIFETDYGRIAGASGGMLVLLAAIWYAANPVIKNRRRYHLLRTEFNKFKILVSDLNRAGVDGLPDEIDKTRSAMHTSIDRMVEAAGKTG